MPRVSKFFCVSTIALLLIAITSSGLGNAAGPAIAERGGSVKLDPMALAANPPGVSYETLHHISVSDPRIHLAGFDFDGQNRPVAGWSESSSGGGGSNFRWARRENNVWVVTTITQPAGGGGVRGESDFVLSPGGTPFFAYAIRDAVIFGQEWYTAHSVDLGAFPNGHGPVGQPIDASQSCLSANPRFALDFAGTTTDPNLLIGTACQFAGWLSLNGVAVHGDPPFRAAAGTGGEFHSLDYATAPNGSHHLTYYAERGGSNFGAYYSNGSPGHELRLVIPHRNRRAETSIAVGPDGRIHVAIGGVPLCDNTFEGGLLYLTSTDGINWTRTFVDETSGRNPSIAVDAQGRPRIAYWRSNTQVRLASLEGAAWTTTPVYTATTPVGTPSVKLGYDTGGQPHVLFFNPDTSDITISSGVHSNLPPAVTNPVTQTSGAGDSGLLQIAATDAEGGVLAYSACNLPPGLSINPNTGLVTGTIPPSTPAGVSQVTVTVTDNAGNTGSVSFNWSLVAKANQTIAFGPLSGKTYGDAPFTISATATSGLPVSFSVLSGPATLSGNVVTITGVGTVTVRASQAGDASFNAAIPVDQSFTVAAPTFQPVVLTPDQVEIKTWIFQGRTYAYLKLLFPNAGYRVANWGQAVRAGNEFSADAAVEKFTGASVQAVTTTAQIYDLGPLADGNYTFTFKNSGTVVKSQAFTVSSAIPPPNPIDNAREFVKQQYRDFLNRESDQAGEDFWTDNITKCSDPARRPAGQSEAQCALRQRETTSGAFFLSPEFQYTGYYVYRMYQGALGRPPKLSEFIPDAQFVGNGIVVNGQLSAAKINQNKADFAAQFQNCTDATKYRCAEFKARYDGLNNTQYVDKLFETTGVNATAPDRADLVNSIGASQTRASVLQKVVDGINVISEGNQQFTTSYGQAFYNSEFNRAFVHLEYFGYMKRDPDEAGYAFWLGKLNQFGGDFVNAEMVLAFISSPEYRARFGQP